MIFNFEFTTMNVEIVAILILDILVIGGIAIDDVVVEYKSHTDNYDITTIYKTTSGYNAGEESNRKLPNVTKCFGCYEAKIHLRTNAIGMPIELNGLILSSNKKSLEFIADSKYSDSVSTRNQIDYNIEEWAISKLSMADPAAEILQIHPDYELLLWNAESNAESFKIKWKQINLMKMCISVSYLLEDESKCTFSINLTDEDSPRVIYSTNIKESKVLKTVLFKSVDWLYENKTYTLYFNLEKKSSKIRKYSYDEDYETGSWSDDIKYEVGCKIGIKRIAQCTDEYENEEILTVTAEELRSTQYEGTLFTFNVYPFDVNTQQMESISPSSVCSNRGFPNKNGCTCPPGFKGNTCEHGCGPNKFGVDCTGICSMHQTQCRQMMFCTKGFGCN